MKSKGPSDNQRLSLVGHYNPTGEYPAPVVPIFENEDQQFFAVYHSSTPNTPIEFRPVSSSQDFVRHRNLDIQLISDFDPCVHNIFAFEHDDLIPIHLACEREDYTEIFADPRCRQANPFMWLSLVSEFGLPEQVRTVLNCCISELGGRNDFTRKWYSQMDKAYDFSKMDIPTELDHFTENIVFLRLACSISKVDLITKLAREFNSRFTDTRSQRQLVAVNRIPDQEIVDKLSEWSFDAVVPDTDDSLKDRVGSLRLDQVVIGQDKLVLALNPNRFSADKYESNWQSVCETLLSDANATWIRSRSNTTAGMLLDQFLTDNLRSDVVAQLSKRVERYAPSVQEITEIAFRDNKWQVDVITLLEGSVKTLRSKLSPNLHPIIVEFPELEYGVETSLWSWAEIDTPQHSVFLEFGKLIESQEGKAEIARNGLIPGGTPETIAVEARALAAKNVMKERPIALCIVADISGSMEGSKLDNAKVGMSTLLGFINADRNDAIGLFTFEDQAAQVVGLDLASQVADQVGNQIASLRASNGRTALLDSIVLASEKLQSYQNHIKAIVLLTDGHENASRNATSIEEVIDTLSLERNGSITVFSLAYGDDADKQLLKKLSSMTGGDALAGNVSNIATLFKWIGGRL